ncbi:MAG: MCE family protein, partial [Mycobacteriaceae bacterium]|nr:MCE family protein [Mycobacteriaceae bacterium]
TAYFTSTKGLYVGDDVRVLGVPVGRGDAIDPGPESVKVTLAVRRSVSAPADARAVIIAPTLVSGRFVQLAPVYKGGPKLRAGARIPLEHTAVPVEWDEVKTELDKLAKALGPTDGRPGGALGRALDVASDNLGGGNAAAMQQTLRDLSHTMSLLSDGRNDLFSTVRNLQTFVNTLSNSNTQIVQFGGRLASVSKVLAGSGNELGAALDQLDVAMGHVAAFIETNKATLTTSVSRLADATRILAEKRESIARVLHIAPTSLANFYNIYNPAQGALGAEAQFVNMRNPFAFVCGSIAALETNDSKRSAQLCAQHLAPIINSFATNYPGFSTQPVVGATAHPDQLRYSPPSVQQRAVERNLGAFMMPGGGSR